MPNSIRWLAGCYLGLIYVFLFIPAILVVVFSFNDSQFWAFPLRGFTWRWYFQLTQRPDALEALQNSVVVAIMTMILAVLVGGSIAVAVGRLKSSIVGYAEAVMLIPQIIPTLILGLSLLLLMTALGIRLGMMTVILGHVLFTSPYVFLLVRARYHSLDPNLENAARGLGASPLRSFHKVVMPHLAPAFIAGGLVVFAVSFSDVIIAFFLSGGGYNTLPVFIYSLIQYEPSAMINAVASIVFIVVVVMFAGALLFVGREVSLLGSEKRSNG